MTNDLPKASKKNPTPSDAPVEKKPARFRLRTGLKAGEANSEKIGRF